MESDFGMNARQILDNVVVRSGNCTGCGACVAWVRGASVMRNTLSGPIPDFASETIGEEVLRVCPALSSL